MNNFQQRLEYWTKQHAILGETFSHDEDVSQTIKHLQQITREYSDLIKINKIFHEKSKNFSNDLRKVTDKVSNELHNFQPVQMRDVLQLWIDTQMIIKDLHTLHQDALETEFYGPIREYFRHIQPVKEKEEECNLASIIKERAIKECQKRHEIEERKPQKDEIALAALDEKKKEKEAQYSIVAGELDLLVNSLMMRKHNELPKNILSMLDAQEIFFSSCRSAAAQSRVKLLQMIPKLESPDFVPEYDESSDEEEAHEDDNNENNDNNQNNNGTEETMQRKKRRIKKKVDGLPNQPRSQTTADGGPGEEQEEEDVGSNDGTDEEADPDKLKSQLQRRSSKTVLKDRLQTFQKSLKHHAARLKLPKINRESGHDLNLDDPTENRKRTEPVYVQSIKDLPKDVQKQIRDSHIDMDTVFQNWFTLLRILRFVTGVNYRDISEKEDMSIETSSKTDMDFETVSLLVERVISDESPVDKFSNLCPIGDGGYGRVFSAVRNDNKSKVAIKKIHHVSRHQKKRNYEEVLLLSQLSHPNIVTYISSYTDPTTLWIVMEYLEGGPLNYAIKICSFKEKQIAYIAREVAKGMQYLHSVGIIHRDLKSNNIMLGFHGDVKLIDFGLCYDIGKTKNPVVHMVGSPFWMSPEIILGRPHNTPTDVWSYGICVLEMANGTPPQRKSSIKAMYYVATNQMPGLDHPLNWSADFIDFVTKCIQFEPSKRSTSDALLLHPFLQRAVTREGISKIVRNTFMSRQIIDQF